MRLVITGGNGFIGREVCRHAVAAGHDVTSISRSGPPEPEKRGGWAGNVTWVAGDVFAPQEWRDHLKNADAVVHSIGIISERPADGVTFERVNGDAGIIVALEAERADVDRFVYLSSSTTPPFVRDAYIEAKRRAEAAIADLNMDVAVLRPGPVYGPGQPHFPKPVNWFFSALGRVGPVWRRLGADRPLSVETVGEVTFRLASAPQVPETPMDGTDIATY